MAEKRALCPSAEVKSVLNGGSQDGMVMVVVEEVLQKRLDRGDTLNLCG